MFGKGKTGGTPSPTVLELIERLSLLAADIKTLRAEVESLKTEWADARDQLRRSYQRLEKAAQRVDRVQESDDVPVIPADTPIQAHGFARKWSQIQQNKRGA